MQGYEFRYGPQLISGPGAARRLAELLPEGRCLFVTDANVRALGLADAVLAALPDTIVFDAVEEDPSRATLMAAVELIRASEELYGRVSRLDQGSFAEDAGSPARSLLSRLQRSF